jgi:hypothetical protein
MRDHCGQAELADQIQADVGRKAFNGAFHRWVHRLRPLPVESRLISAM